MSTVNDADFRQSEKDWHAFVDKVTERLIEIDDTVPELPVKDVVSLLKFIQPCARATLEPNGLISDRSFAFTAMSGSARIRHRTR